MSKKKEDNRDIFDKVAGALVPIAAYGAAARLASKTGRRLLSGERKPTRKEAARDEDAAWRRESSDRLDNTLTAYGSGYGGLVSVVGPDPRYVRRERRK